MANSYSKPSLYCVAWTSCLPSPLFLTQLSRVARQYPCPVAAFSGRLVTCSHNSAARCRDTFEVFHFFPRFCLSRCFFLCVCVLSLVCSGFGHDRDTLFSKSLLGHFTSCTKQYPKLHVFFVSFCFSLLSSYCFLMTGNLAVEARRQVKARHAVTIWRC